MALEFMTRLLVRGSWLSLGTAVMVALTALFCQWGIDARSLGAHDAGWAIFLASVGAIALVGSTYAAPVLAALGLLTLSFQPRAACRFLAAGATFAVPLAALTWLH